MNHAAPQSTVPTPITARDSLAALFLDVITSPNQGAESLAERCASVSLAFTDLAGSDDRLAAKHRAIRERALVAALASTLKIVEVADLAAAIKIVDQLCASVLPLPGEPIVLVCNPDPIVPLIEEGDVAIQTITQFLAEGGAR